jgi:hypothetical protein
MISSLEFVPFLSKWRRIQINRARARTRARLNNVEAINGHFVYAFAYLFSTLFKRARASVRARLTE